MNMHAQAVEAVLSGQVESAFAIVRPPGHHAEPSGYMGFCFFNNVAVAAHAALKHPGIQRVLILDWDVSFGALWQLLRARRMRAGLPGCLPCFCEGLTDYVGQRGCHHSLCTAQAARGQLPAGWLRLSSVIVCLLPSSHQVHAGNGTQKVFYEDDRVLFVSLHRRDKDFYPEVRTAVGRQADRQAGGMYEHRPFSKRPGRSVGAVCGKCRCCWHVHGRCSSLPRLVSSAARPHSAVCSPRVCAQGIGYATEVGEGAGRGYNVNVPWAETKMGDGDYMAGESSWAH
jgi:hypothetical protein